MHSHNITRRIDRRRSVPRWLLGLRILLLVLGVCALGYYGYSVADQYVYQAYQNWAFDQQIAGRRAVTVGDYLREKTPFGFLAGAKPRELSAPVLPAIPASNSGQASRPVEGSVLGKVEIPRLNLAAMVREGVDAKTLSVAVGHVPSTALPGQQGNFAIAAHRDTLFRALKDIRKEDLVRFQSPSGNYTYQVLATRIVQPSDVSILRSDGGGLIPAAGTGNDKLLTMITCYPFNYVGSAPKRFIVEAKLVPEAQSVAAAPPPPTAEPEHVTPPRRAVVHTQRHSSRPRPTRSVRAEPAPKPIKKRGLWHRVFHVS